MLTFNLNFNGYNKKLIYSLKKDKLIMSSLPEKLTELFIKRLHNALENKSVISCDDIISDSGMSFKVTSIILNDGEPTSLDILGYTKEYFSEEEPENV